MGNHWLQIAVESDDVAELSWEKVLSGKHFNGAVSLYKIVF